MFFRAGVLGQMEELRDERLGRIMSWMQSWIRGYLARKDYKKIQEQRLALQVVQRNLRKYMQLRTWPWYKLWQKVKPLLNVSRIEDEIAVSIFFSFPVLRHLEISAGILFSFLSVWFDGFSRRCHRREWHIIANYDIQAEWIDFGRSEFG